MVSEFGSWGGPGSIQVFIWKIPWRRELFDLEKVLEMQILELITSASIKGDSTDQWCWVGENTNAYTFQSTYWALKELPVGLQNKCF